MRVHREWCGRENGRGGQEKSTAHLRRGEPARQAEQRMRSWPEDAPYLLLIPLQLLYKQLRCKQVPEVMERIFGLRSNKRTEPYRHSNTVCYTLYILKQN